MGAGFFWMAGRNRSFSAGAFRMEEGVVPSPRRRPAPLLKTSRGMICLADPAGMDGAKNPFCGPKRPAFGFRCRFFFILARICRILILSDFTGWTEDREALSCAMKQWI